MKTAKEISGVFDGQVALAGEDKRNFPTLRGVDRFKESI